MKKILLFVLLAMFSITLTGCDLFGGDGGGNDFVPDRIKLDGLCDGMEDYILVNGECVDIKELVSENITINSDETVTMYQNSIELMDDFVADVTDSAGLAVVSRDIYDSQTQAQSAPSLLKLSQMAVETEEEDPTENLIVKLTEDGFFEEVDFQTEDGIQVDVIANPLALEVYGPWTIIIFEVNADWYDENYQPNFDQMIWDSLWAGGVYLIHNETGKMFPTKTVDYQENTWSWTENHSRTVWLDVTLNQPVVEMQQVLRVDDDGKPVYDENGSEIWDDVAVPLLDSNGDPIIITEGPILTEMIEVPIVEYYDVQQVDENGDPIYDENGEPVYETVEEPLLDENGNAVTEVQEVAVLDENGNPVYQQTFQMEFFIEDIVTYTQTEYYANVTDNAVSGVAQKFVDQIIADYYNWDYYRVNNYSIQHWGFAATDDFIFYMEDHIDPDDNSNMEKFVMRMGFDTDTNELLLEQYINASKANFDECEVIIDPRNGNVICDPWNWEENIKIYSPTNGLNVIPDSGELTPVTFPNGELYFYQGNQVFVEELGYYTTLLYNINSDGTLESHYIQLGERQELCNDPMGCYRSLNIDFFDGDGNQMNDWDYWMEFDFEEGDPFMSAADLELTALGEFDSSRPDCEDSFCWFNVFYEILDDQGEVVADFERGVEATSGDAAPAYGYTYTLDGNETIEYKKQWSSIIETCDNAIGCVNDMNFVDYGINQYGLWLYDNSDTVVPDGAQLINMIQMKDVNNAVYEYTKLVEGEVCPAEYDSCEEYIDVYFYDIDGESMTGEWHSNIRVEVPGGEVIPLYIEYTITDNSTTTVDDEDDVCTTSDGCWRYYPIDGNTLSAYYEQGDTIYATIEGVEKNSVLSETLESEVCAKTDGCSLGEEISYTIVDPDGNVLYEFTNTWPWADYGEQLPYHVTAVYDEDDDTASDVEIFWRYESSEAIKTCDDVDGCGDWVEYVIDTGVQYEWQWLGSYYTLFDNGEQIIQRVIFPQDVVPTSTQTENTCQWEEGCQMNTENFNIYDVDGNEYFLNDEWWTPSVTVYFNQGDVMPVDNNFHATFEISNIEYQMRRLYIYDFIWNLNEVVILDEDLYLIERDSWTEGTDNVILEYDEVNGIYSAMYTNLSAVTEITQLGDSYVAINDLETGIIKFTFNATISDNNYYYFDEEDLTQDLNLFGVNDLIVDFDGSIYFKGVDNFINDVTGTILEDGTVTLDTEYTERDVIRVRPIN